MVKITIYGKSFEMTDTEWIDVRELILNDRQVCATRWWAKQFDLPVLIAVKIVNYIQITIQYGTVDQILTMASLSPDSKLLQVTERASAEPS